MMALRATPGPPIPSEVVALFRKSEVVLAHVACRVSDGKVYIKAHALLVADRSTEGNAA